MTLMTFPPLGRRSQAAGTRLGEEDPVGGRGDHANPTGGWPYPSAAPWPGFGRWFVDAGEVWWFELPHVGRKPGVVCSRRAVNLRLMPVVARIATVDREARCRRWSSLAAGEVEGLAEDGFALAHDLFLAGPAAPAVARPGG